MKIIGKKESHFRSLNYVLFNYGWGHRHWNISQFGQKQNGLNSKCEQLVQYYWDHNLQVLEFTPVWNKNASWKLSEKESHFAMSFLCPFELGLSSSPVKYFTIWTKTKRFEFKMWTIGAGTPETITYKFWSFTPVWNKNASWKLSEKKKIIFYEFFMSFWIRVELIAREIFHNLDKNKTIWIQNVNNWCRYSWDQNPQVLVFTTVWNKNASWKLSEKKKVIFYEFFMSFHENYRKKRKSFSMTFLCPFQLGLSSSPVEYFTIWTKTKRFEFKMWTIGAGTPETITYKFWVSPQCEIKMLHETYRKKRKSFSMTFFMSFSIRVELIAREIFHNLDKNKTIWIQNVNNWCSTTGTRTHKFWSSPQCEIKMLHENYRKKRKWFRLLFLSFWISVELIAREIFHNLDKNKTVWIQNVNKWSKMTFFFSDNFHKAFLFHTGVKPKTCRLWSQ